MRVGYLQFDPVFGEVAHNLDLITARLEEAEADLLVLPELCASGYQFVSQEEVSRLAEPVPCGNCRTPWDDHRSRVAGAGRTALL